MRRMKKVMAIVLMAAMVLALNVTAFAAGTFSQTAETSITVTDLVAGDTATAYQILKYNATTGAWELNGSFGSLTVDNLTDDISSAEAATIANNLGAIAGKAMTIDGTTATLTDVAPGLYYVKVTPGASNDYIYNPIFVSADYYSGGNSIAASSSYKNESIAKKQPVTVEKTMTDANQKDVAVGDIVSFKVETTIPTYTDAYSTKSFVITDTLSTGLEMLDTDAKADTDHPFSISSDKGTLTKTTDYTVTKGTSGYTVTFTDAYLDGLTSNPKITITYSAKVTSDAVTDVTEMTNEAKVTYTHDPSGTPKEVTDKTYHYTFSIGASILGNTENKTKELVKTANGEEKWVYNQEPNTITKLADAEFALYKSEADATAGKDAIDTCTTLADGVITFNGLDEGTYYLKETKAPTGYAINNATVRVVIAAQYNNNGTLKSYSVTVGGNKSEYTFSNNGTTNVVTTNEGSMTSAFKNTPGQELPSTGGIGTTVFYVIGCAMVVGAGVVMITRRRMGI